MMTSKTFVALLAAAASLTAGCGRRQAPSESKEAWNSANDPLLLGSGYERRLASLPTSGQLDKTPWSDSYWPSTAAGLAHRWNSADGESFAYTPPERSTWATMTQAEMAQLSPAEKFDIYTGDDTFRLLRSERARTNANAPAWEGICHGWAPAALLYDEPKAVLLTGYNGVKVPFGSADIKALLDLYTGNFAQARSRSLGSRCNIDLEANPDAATNPACRDVNAGSFHVVLTNFIGLRKKGFVADVTRDLEVWNQPVYAFDAVVTGRHAPSEGAAPGTVEEAEVTAAMTYAVETSPIWDAVGGTRRAASTTKTYHYRVELNAQGEVIGGEWDSEDRPDFLWTKELVPFKGDFEPLKKIFQASQMSGNGLADPSE